MSAHRPSLLLTTIATCLAMTAFAANSILCRLALGPGEIDAAGFTTIRLISGAITLFVIARVSKHRRSVQSIGTWTSAAALFTYAILFSFAYLRLGVGTGALILFGFVQATMILWGIVCGERPRPHQWIGLVTALGGLLYLVSPGLSAPPIGASAMMAAAGTAWGIYSLRGRATTDPVVTTTDNFIRSVPMVLIITAIFYRDIDLSPRGIALAILSGGLASGVGYVVWYAALRGLSATRAAAVQLTVPVIAALGGLVFLQELVSARLVVSAALILGGVGVTLLGRDGPARETRLTDSQQASGRAGNR